MVQDVRTWEIYWQLILDTHTDDCDSSVTHESPQNVHFQIFHNKHYKDKKIVNATCIYKVST